MHTQRRSLHYVALSVAAAAFACKTTTVHSDASVKVIGGSEDYTTNPAAIGLLMTGGMGTFLCTGAVVRDDLVVTAAHCIVDFKSKVVKPFFDLSDDANSPALFQRGLSSSSFLVFPTYSAANTALISLNSDIAFIVFPKGTFADYPQAKFASQGVAVGDVVTMVGYGQTAFHDHGSNPQKKRFSGTNQVAEINHSVADAILLKSAVLSETTAATGQGDSGGAVFNTSGEIIGISNANAMLGNSRDHPVKSAEKPIGSYCVNSRDPGVAAFIAAVMNDPNPTTATVQGIKPTVISPRTRWVP
ncbi:MAG: trypsin-like serine protease [Proteobacteria bacterium]|nr:trypsin-like serine protease [Pseudomonadota bacterium]